MFFLKPVFFFLREVLNSSSKLRSLRTTLYSYNCRCCTPILYELLFSSIIETLFFCTCVVAAWFGRDFREMLADVMSSSAAAQPKELAVYGTRAAW